MPRLRTRKRTGIKSTARALLAAMAVVVCSAPASAIVGASQPATELAPFIVMVLNRSGSTSGFCSASVIAQDVVLTAAHCVADPANTRVHFHGAHGEPVIVEVAAIIKHPAYHADAARTRHVSIDLALIRLARPLPASFQPILIAEMNSIKPGDTFRIAGFGVTQEGAAASSGVLRTGRIAARAPLSSILLWADDPTHQGTGACTGDSGGPILASDAPMLIAVTDWAEGMGQQQCGSLTQGALVAQHRAWMNGVMTEWHKAD